ncbi:gliding motility-associated C-terminal domain-containing protein [Cesiribacter andamanensis]|uniref:Ig-like domain-containing protein n=1 Tax=Cesiribacter andamanensis AMV16 TaxID=1279009 RepID=M7N1C5_9BACT|nr:gliding motility-associated C-terminal domain-containing protein [Cesiribacter andamanensis]EMR01097.1 hypothetical protein ADICEAN_03785 [Cesiribacter andamanensis AMV16]
MAADITGQTNCLSSGNGSARVTAISYGGAADAPANYTYQWTNAAGAPVGTGETISGLVAGTYYVVATKANGNPGSSCASAPFEVVVPNTPVYPTIALSSLPNTACDNTYTGQIDAQIGFTTSYDWALLQQDGTPTAYSGTASTSATLSIGGLAPGIYLLQVTDLNGCPATEQITVGEDLTWPIVITADTSPQTACASGNGTAWVSGISFNGVAQNVADYLYSWSWIAADGSTQTGSGTTLSGLLAGTYTVTAIKNNGNPGSGCQSAPFQVTVVFEPTNPVATLDGTDNTSCLAGGNGSLTATLSDFGTQYTYVLYKDGQATSYSGTASTASLTFSNLLEGEYRLEVRAENGCPVDAYRNIQRVEVGGELTLSGLDQRTCNPDGAVSVTQILFGGESFSGAAILLNFDLVLIDANTNTRLTHVATASTNGATFAGLPAGNYTVEATKRSGIGMGCFITAMMGVADISTDPVLEVASYNMISECFGNPKGMVGMLVREADGSEYTSNPGHYTVSWQYRATLSSTTYLPYPGTDFSISNLDPGFYTLNITNTLTGCSQSLEFEIQEVVVEIALRATADNQTFCTPENGQLLVQVINEEEIRATLGFLPTFDFEVYRGDISTPTGSFYDRTANAEDYFRSQYGADTYSIFAWFNGQNVYGCIGGVGITIDYIDNTPFPTATVEAELSICDPTRGNATASAHVNGITEGYSFTWYAGEIGDVSTPLGQTGPVATGLAAGTYWVEVIDTYTSCPGSVAITVDEYNPEIPFVEAMLEATVATSCAAPNGSMRVIVSNYNQYNFYWYAGQTVDPANQISTGTDTHVISNLAEGYYTVVAEDKQNGCISNAVTKYLGGDYTYPDYEIMLTPASCEVPGTARVVDLSGTLLSYTIWDAQGNQVGDHTAPFSGIAGTYLLKVVSTDGCEKSEPFTITDTVAPFNGVTPNGDGQNDYFHFSCIDLYPQNLLRIYNRAGGLVFELNGYDNQLKVFSGKGNRGLYIGDKDLPAGTYFWVLFRNNTNEKPKPDSWN